MYAVMVNVTYDVRKRGQVWSGGYGLPMFYLDENVQGITSEDDAVRVAHGIVAHQPEGKGRFNVEYHITASKL